MGGAAPVRPVTGAGLRFAASAIGARSVVEIGTGCGVSGLWLLRGMRPGAVLTSVDVEPDHQRLARAVFVDAGFPAGRYRLISGRALEVTKEGRGIVMRVPLVGGGRLVVELSPDEAVALGEALKSAVG